jgi:hypothetical protein
MITRLKLTLASSLHLACALFATLWMQTALSGATPHERLTLTEEFAFEAHPIHAKAGFETAITHHEGAIYAVFLDPDLKVTVVKKDARGQVEKATVDDFPVRNDLHHTPSIIVDAGGYVHVTGNMHNLPSNEQAGDPYAGNSWRYWRSKRPGDISRWEFVDDRDVRSIPREAVGQPSYVRFFRSAGDTIFASFRGNSGLMGPGGWAPGKYAAYLARYEADAQRWELIGGPGESGARRDVFAHELAGAGGGGYQPIQPSLFCSADGRIHFVTTINADNSVHPKGNAKRNGYRSGTHVFYAQSRDDGRTWTKADGSPITLPLTTDTADIVVSVTPGTIFNGVWVAETGDGDPLVQFNEDSIRKWTTWNGQRWTEPKRVSKAHGNIVSDKESVVSFISKRGELVRSWDQGATTKAYSLPAVDHSIGFDSLYAATHRDALRVLLFDPSGGNFVVRALTVEFED